MTKERTHVDRATGRVVKGPAPRRMPSILLSLEAAATCDDVYEYLTLERWKEGIAFSEGKHSHLATGDRIKGVVVGLFSGIYELLMGDGSVCKLPSDILQEMTIDSLAIEALAVARGLTTKPDKGKWYFYGPRPLALASPDTGLADDEALEWLRSYEDGK